MSTQNRLTPDDLRVGGSYVHSNGSFIRTIDSIEADTVRWHDQYGPGICSRKAFLKVCQSVLPNDGAAEVTIGNHLMGLANQAGEFTLRDEANALTAYAFRNGYLEDLHAGKDSPLLNDLSLSRITDEEMKRLTIEASEKLTEMLKLKQEDPAAYEAWLRSYHWRYCRKWKRE
jgi:hypothetical protein